MVEDEYSEDIYDDKGVEDAIDGDEISAEEAGFMEGFNSDAGESKCEECSNVIVDRENFYEIEVDGEKHVFDSIECRDKWLKKKGYNVEDFL